MEPIIDVLKLGLDGAQLRQKAISNNMANVDTPNYKRQDVNFKDQLKKEISAQKRDNLEMEATHPDHHGDERDGSKAELEVTRDDDGRYRNDNNNVDIDVEMAEMAKNQIYYNTLSQQISNKFQMLNKVIDKGGRS